MTGISVIVCCYNSASRLPNTLQYLAKQSLSKEIPCEILIVDNASTDNTANVARKEWSKYDSFFSFDTVVEKEPGLINARRRGVKSSKHNLIVFCDDDNWLDSKYLSTAWSIMNHNPNIGALGGQGVEIGEIAFPKWFHANKGFYACGKQLPTTGIATSRSFLWGAGLVSRRHILELVFSSEFPFLLVGRKKGKLLAGDDNEICKRIILLGFDLYYDERLLFKHFLTKERINQEYLINMLKGFNYSNKLLLIYHHLISTNYNLSLFSIIKISFYSILKKLKFRKAYYKHTYNFLLFYKLLLSDNEYRQNYKLLKKFSTTMALK